MGLINLLLLLAAAQGILLSFLIIHKHRRLFANYFLAALMFLLSITLLYLMLSELGLYKEYPFLMLIPIGFPLIVSPLFYLYAKYLIQHTNSFSQKDIVHFLPFILYELYYISDFFKSTEEVIAILDGAPEPHITLRFLIFNWMIIIQGLIYITFIILKLKNYSYSLERAFSNTDKMRLNWLRNISFLVAGVWSVFIAENILYLANIQFYKIFDIATVFAGLLVYSLGYMGLLKSEVFEQPEFIDSYEYTSQPDLDRAMKSAVLKKYEKSGLSEKKANEIMKSLESLMFDQKPFLDSNLTLKQLAEMLAISPHNLSEVINTKLNQNFFDYINTYRVEQVKKDLADPEKQHFTLLSIGMDAGFNSKSSFNSIFKRFTGMTPSEFQKSEYKS